MPELPDLDLFLKPEDVTGEIQVTFQDTGRRVSKDETGFEKDSFEITIKLPNGQNRVWTMNVTSQRMVARKLGTNTDTWVGKNVSLIKTEQNSNNIINGCKLSQCPCIPFFSLILNKEENNHEFRTNADIRHYH